MKTLYRVIRPFLYVAPFALLSILAEAKPVAIVEDLTAPHDNVQLMDFLDEGTLFTLKEGETMILGYLNSCIREEIQGGEILIGKDQSRVLGGSVKREKLSCDGGRNKTQAGRKSDAGAIVFRQASIKNPVAVDYVVNSTQPLIRTGRDETVINLVRLDGKGTVQALEVQDGVADLAKLGIRLEKKVAYRLSSGDKSMTFRISRKATERAPLLSRLIRL